jgi:hypothetical protein
MSQKDKILTIYNELKQVILGTKGEQRLEALKNEFRNAAVKERWAYKQALLKVAQEGDSEPFHNIMFETLASLDTIWTEHIPKKDLLKKFNQAYEAGNYEEAGQICSELINQGLDYHGTVNIGPGTLLPLHLDEPKLIQFSQKEIKILDVDLNLIHQVYIPKGKVIVDVLPPQKYRQKQDTGKENGMNTRAWVLLEDINYRQRLIAPLTRDQKALDLKNKVEVTIEKCSEFNRLSRFQDHLLLIGHTSIYYYKQNHQWEKWLTTKDKITCFEETKEYYWCGIADGHVRIIQSLERPGVRKTFERFSTSIKSIKGSENFIVAASENELVVTTSEGASITGPITNDSAIHQAIIINNEMITVLQHNGRILGRDARQGNILWQINLEDRYDSLITLDERLYCNRERGSAAVFTIPNTQELTKALKKHNIAVTEGKAERDPTAPVQDRMDFSGREDILKEIKDSTKVHYLISGVPRSGKTSLLKILPDILSAKSRCSYLDMGQIIEYCENYKDFESKLFTRLLAQHGIAIEELDVLTGHRRFRELIKRAKGNKESCALCLDNFRLPKFHDSKDEKEFNQLIIEIYIHPDVRMMITCMKSEQRKNREYFSEIRRSAPTQKQIRHIELPPFTEIEAKATIRQLGTFQEQQVEEIYRYTGGFPHLIRLYKNWNSEQIDIHKYSKKIANEYKKTILSYFRELDPDALLVMATLIYKNLISRTIAINNLHNDYPLLWKFIETGSLKDILDRIDNYSKGINGEYKNENFRVEIAGNPRLFQLASQYIPWIQTLFAAYQFQQNPNLANAYQIILKYRDLIEIQPEDEIDDTPAFEKLIEKFKEHFFVKKMSIEARQTLEIPLPNYIIIPLKPWAKGKTIQQFNSLYISLQELVRRARESREEEKAAAKFYILLFSFSDISFEELQEEMAGLERISIIDTQKMKQVLLADNHTMKTREIIFQQLRISERSPYIFAGPVDELFYGRDVEIALARGLPENIGIFGTRTIGKTSLMHKLERDIKSMEGWRVFALDCSRIDNEKKLLSNLAEKMRVSHREISNLRKFSRYITQKAEEDEVQYLFLLDEVDGLIAYDIRRGERIFRTFNKLCTELLESGRGAARFILLGFAEMYEQMGNPKSRLYNFMVFLPLGTLDHESALRLVTSPMKNIFIKWQQQKDAQFLVDQCSGHPMLLQNACHTLLKVLDEKPEESMDIIETGDVDKTLSSPDFQQLCMRYYYSITQLDTKTKKFHSKLQKSLLREREFFLHGIHQITLLTAVILHLKKEKQLFSLNDIGAELKEYGLKISSDILLRILNRLCMYGTLRVKGEPTIIAKEKKDKKEIKKIKDEVKKVEEDIKKDKEKSYDIVEELTVSAPEIFDPKKEFAVKFKYEFAIKIFPKILEATFDGIEYCKKEIEQIAAKMHTKKKGSRRQKSYGKKKIA